MYFQGSCSGRGHAFTPPAMTAVLGWALLSLALPACSDSGTASFASATGGASDVAETAEGGLGGAASSGAAGASPPDLDTALFDSERVLEVQLTLAPSDWDMVRNQTRGIHNLFGADCLDQPFDSPFSYVRAEVTVDAVRLADVGLRKKGFLGSLDADKPSLKLNLDEYVDQDLEGARDITLNNAKQDPGYLNQCLAYAVFAAAGVPAPRCNFAHVMLNGKELGLYVHVEALKKPMLRRFFASDAGNLYEGTLSDFRTGWTGTFDKKTNSADPSQTEIDAITAAAAAPDEELLARLDEVLELDAFFSLWAVETLVEHWDGYASNANNYYAYADPASGKTTLLPWGTDQLFGSSNGGPRTKPRGIATTGVLAHRLYAHPEGRARFDQSLRAVLANVWNEAAVLSEIDRLERLIAPFVPVAAAAAQRTLVESLRLRVGERRAFLEGLLEAPPKAPGKLRGSVCLAEVGDVSGEFSTTWGTAGAANPFASGTATLSVSLDGAPWVFQPDSVSSLAGPGDDPESELAASVVVPALRDDGMLALLYVGLRSEQMRPGDVTINMESSLGLLLEADPNLKDTPATVVGTLLGSLHLDAAGTGAGAPVSGSFEAKLYRTSLLNGE